MPPFFGGLDASSHRVGQDVFGQFATLGYDGRFAGIQNCAIGSGERQSLEFLVKGQELANQSFAGGGDLNRDGLAHKTSVFG